MDPSGLEPILNVLTNVAMILSLVCVGVGVFRVAFNSHMGYPSGGGSMIAGGLVLGGTSFLLPHLFDSLEAARDADEKTPRPSLRNRRCRTSTGRPSAGSSLGLRGRLCYWL